MRWRFHSGSLAIRLFVEPKFYVHGAVILQLLNCRRWQNPWNGASPIQMEGLEQDVVSLLHRKDQVQLRGVLWHECHSWAQASWRSSCSRSLDRYATCPCGAATHKFVHNPGTKSSPTSANTGANTSANTSANTGANTGTNTSANTGTNTGANTSANTGANTCANTHIGSLRRNGCWDCDLDLAHLGPHRWCCCFLLQASEASARRRSSAQCKGSGVELRDAAVPRYPTIIDRCHPCHALQLPCRNQEICVRARL